MVEEQIIQKFNTSLRGLATKIEATKPRRVFIDVPRESLIDVVKILKSEYDGYHISTITVLDTDPDYEIIYHIVAGGVLACVRVLVPKTDPTVNTITPILNGAILYEREIHDMMGIIVKDHPDMRTLLLPDSWGDKGHPLRKDWVDPRQQAEKEGGDA